MKAVALACMALAGCATTYSEQFANNPYAATDATVCLAGKEAYTKSDMSALQSVMRQIERRGLTPERCNAAIEQANKEQQASDNRLIAALAIMAAAQGSRGAPAPQAMATTKPFTGPVLDYDWDWDQFMNGAQQLVWACRGVQTGQFAPDEKCTLKPKLDIRWPGFLFRP